MYKLLFIRRAFFEVNAFDIFFIGDECRTIEISYSGDDLDDEAKEFLGTYDYMGITTKNGAAVYNHTYKQKLGNGRTTLLKAYLVKDWEQEKYWRVVVNSNSLFNL